MPVINKVYLQKIINNVLSTVYPMSSADAILYKSTTVSAELESLANDLSSVITSETVDAKIKAESDKLYNKIMGITDEDNTSVSEAYDTLKEVAAYLTNNGSVVSGFSSDIQALQTVVGDINSGLVKQVNDLSTLVDDTREELGLDSVFMMDDNGNILQYKSNELVAVPSIHVHPDEYTEENELIERIINDTDCEHSFSSGKCVYCGEIQRFKLVVEGGTITNPSVNNVYLAKTKVTVVANDTDANDNPFMYWYDEYSDSILTTEKELKYPIVEDSKLVAVFGNEIINTKSFYMIKPRKSVVINGKYTIDITLINICLEESSNIKNREVYLFNNNNLEVEDLTEDCTETNQEAINNFISNLPTASLTISDTSKSVIKYTHNNYIIDPDMVLYILFITNYNDDTKSSSGVIAFSYNSIDEVRYSEVQ